MSDVIVAPAVRDLGELARQLTDWLAKRMPGAREITLGNLDYPRGAGQSHETILFDMAWLEGGERRTQGCVVRIKPQAFTVFPDNPFEQQYRIMQLMHEQGHVRVAKPLWYEPAPDLLRAPFFVMEKVSGRVPVSVPPYRESGWVFEASPAQRRRMWEAGVRQMASVQKVSPDAARFLAGPDHARDGLAQELDKYTRFVAWVQQDRPWPVLERGLARIKALAPQGQPAGIVWGDARLGNIMFGPDFDVVAVMDWEQPSLGGALQDLGWWLVNSEAMHGAAPGREHLAGMGSREETIALWQEVAGLPTDDIGWYEDFTRLKMSCCSVRMSALRGTPPPDEGWLAKRLKVD
ncbi:MAG: phosphotransferase family protein [Sphingomonadales bacterium]|nr:phosphotransferase family protein [Sphingomonadales bacterium]